VEDIIVIIIIFISINPIQTRMCLHIHGRRINQTRNQCEAGSKLGFCLLPANAGFLPGLFFDPKDGGDIPPKYLLTFHRLHFIKSQMTELSKPLLSEPQILDSAVNTLRCSNLLYSVCG
jgi:hypothetical protein